MCVGAINVLVRNSDSKNLLSCLLDPHTQLQDVSAQYIDAYLHHLTQLKNSRPLTGINMYTTGHTQVLICTLYTYTLTE